MSEALLPGAVASAVANRSGVCRSLRYTWLRLARDGGLPGAGLAAPKVLPESPRAASFLPVTVVPAPSPSSAEASAPPELAIVKRYTPQSPAGAYAAENRRVEVVKLSGE